jgi:hypothetical protein
MGSVKSKNQWTAAGVSLNFYIAIAIAIAIATVPPPHAPARPLPRA